ANAVAALRDRMPYVTNAPDGPRWTACNGAAFGRAGGVGPAGQKYGLGVKDRADVMAATGLYDDGRKGIRRPTDPHLRVAEMERDGGRAEGIFGVLGGGAWGWRGVVFVATRGPPTRRGDHEAAAEMFRIYNDWLLDFCRHYPERHVGLACLPYGDIPAAVREIHRVAKMGLRGLELSCSWDREPMWHPVWEPLWQAVSEVSLPLHFHTFPTMPPGVGEKATGLTKRAAMFTSVSGFQMNLVNILAAVIGAAVLERYP